MLFYKHRRKLIKYLRYLRVLFKISIIPVEDKTVFFDVTGIVVNRYLYCLLKMFQIEGYSVFIPRDINIANTISNTKGEFKYASWLISEKVVKFGRPAKPDLQFSRDQLSNDYFQNTKVENSFHQPMSEYPGIYKNKFYRSGDTELERKNSIFMSGNIDAELYGRISNAGFFDILSRREVADYVLGKGYSYAPKTLGDLNKFVHNELDHKVVIIDTKNQFSIPIENLKSVLERFNFYLALPGILIPQSHNLVEAMSVGCIPVIHRRYAALMHPPLEDNTNCLTYSNLEELEVLIREIFKLNSSSIIELRGNVQEYFQKHLSPTAVVRKIEEGNFSKIYIQAEQISLNYLKMKKLEKGAEVN